MTLILLISGEIIKTWEHDVSSLSYAARVHYLKQAVEVAQLETAEIRYKEERQFYWSVLSAFPANTKPQISNGKYFKVKLPY